MNLIRKMFLILKNIFIKQDEVKKLQEPKTTIEYDGKKSFIESLKATTTQKRTKKKVEVLTCDGDGLGIQKKITC